MPELNYPGPYELRLNYTVTISGVAHSHTARYNVDCDPAPTPGQDPSTVLLVRRGTSPGTVPMDEWADEWADIIAALTTSALNINFVELWSYEPESFNGDFVTTYDIDVPGDGANAPTVAGQVIITFRTIEGGILKLNFMEAGLAVGQSLSMGTVSGVYQAIRDHVLSDDNVFLGRDTSMPFAALRLHPGQNEALFKKRFRQI